MMQNNLDVSFLINKLFEIEKIKLVLNNKDLELLNHQRPKIFLDKKKFQTTEFKNEIEKKFQSKFYVRDSYDSISSRRVQNRSNQNTIPPHHVSIPENTNLILQKIYCEEVPKNMNLELSNFKKVIEEEKDNKGNCMNICNQINLDFKNKCNTME